jgi:hypothetical protein
MPGAVPLVGIAPGHEDLRRLVRVDAGGLLAGRQQRRPVIRSAGAGSVRSPGYAATVAVERSTQSGHGYAPDRRILHDSIEPIA